MQQEDTTIEEQPKQSWKERLTITPEKPPKLIRSLEPQTTNVLVHITKLPSVITSIDTSRLQALYRENLGGLRLDLAKTVASGGYQSQEVNVAELLEGISTGKIDMTFAGGHIPIRSSGEESLIAVPVVQISGETLQVSVNGPQQVVDEALERLCVHLFESAGLSIRWREIQNRIFAVSYKTAVKVDFGFTALQLLHPDMQQALDGAFPDSTAEDVKEHAPSHRFGAQFVSTYKGTPEIRPKITTYDATIAIQGKVFDTVSGSTNQIEFQITQEGTHERGSPILHVIANCDHSTLRSILTSLAERLHAHGNGDKSDA